MDNERYKAKDRRVRRECDRNMPTLFQDEKRLLKAKQLYESGLTLDLIAKEFGCGRQTVNRAFNKAGIKKRRQGSGKHISIPDEVLEEMVYANNISMGSIDEKLGTSRGAVRRRLIKLNKQIGKGNKAFNYFTRECKCCGKTFKTKYRDKQYCSIACRKKQFDYIRSVRNRITNIEHFDSSISIGKIRKRDKEICCLCGKPVDDHDYKVVNGCVIVGKNYPSIDHIIPLANGGTHSIENVQLAHFGCNRVKKDKPLSEVMINA